MTPQEIRDAIAADPELQALAAEGRVGDIAAALSVGRSKLGTLSVGDFASWAAATGMRAVIEDHALNAQSPMRSVALALRDVLVGGTSGIRMDLPGNQAMLQAWVDAGELTTAARDDLLALASVPDPVTAAAVSDALEGGV